MPFQTFLHDLQSLAGFRKIRREAERFLKHRLRPSQIALAGKNQAPVQVRLRVLGRILDGLLKKGHCFGIPSQLGIERAKVVLGFGILWIDANRLLKGLPGFRDLPLFRVADAQRVMGERQLRIQRDRFFEFSLGAFWIIQAKKHKTQIVPRTSTFRVKLQSLTKHLCRTHQIPPLEECIAASYMEGCLILPGFT